MTETLDTDDGLPITDDGSPITAPPTIPPGPSLVDDLRGAMHAWLANQRPRDAREREALIAAWKAGADSALAEVRLRLTSGAGSGTV